MEHNIFTLSQQIMLSKSEGQSWGFRITGGADLGAPLTIIKVYGGTIAENAGLQVGDILLGINEYLITNLTHQEAYEALVNAGNSFFLRFFRGNSSEIPDIATDIANSEALSTSENVSAVEEQQDTSEPLFGLDAIIAAVLSQATMSQAATEFETFNEVNVNQDTEQQFDDLTEQVLFREEQGSKVPFMEEAELTETKDYGSESCTIDENLAADYQLETEIVETKIKQQSENETIETKVKQQLKTETIEIKVEQESESETEQQIKKETVETKGEQAKTETIETKHKQSKTETVETKDKQLKTETIETKAEQSKTKTIETKAEQSKTEMKETKVEQQSKSETAEMTQSKTETIETKDEQAKTETIEAKGEQAKIETIETKSEQVETKGEQTKAGTIETKSVQAKTETTETKGEQAITETIETKGEHAITETIETKGEQAITETIETKGEQAITETIETKGEQAITETTETKGEQAITETIETKGEQAKTETTETKESKSEQSKTETIETNVEQQSKTETIETKAEQQSKIETIKKKVADENQPAVENVMADARDEKQKIDIQEKHKKSEKSKPLFPLTPRPRPVKISGNIKFSIPTDAYDDEFIAETLSGNAEVITGTTLGVNFQKYKRNYDFLKSSSVYRMIQEQENKS